jgi:hypothetical protein
LPDAKFDRLPEDVQARINALCAAVRKPRPRQALAEVRALIAQYPEIPQLHNYLYAACYNLGEHAEAARVPQETVRRFPDYLFGRIAWAEEYLRRREPAEASSRWSIRLPEKRRATVADGPCSSERAAPSADLEHQRFSTGVECDSDRQLVGSRPPELPRTGRGEEVLRRPFIAP